MRQMERVQVGMALVGMVFCLTTPLALLRHAAHRTPKPGMPTFEQLEGKDLTADGSVMVVRGSDAWHPPVDVISATDKMGSLPFAALANSVNQAALTNATAMYPYELIFYRPTGQRDRVFYANPDGVLLDSQSHLRFQAPPILQTYLEQVRKQ